MKGSIAIIILAAGSSSRLGQPKQLLQYNNKSLLQHVVSQVMSLQNILPLLVLGSSKQIIEKDVEDLNIEIVHNDDWQLGMSTSIKAGLSAALKKNKNLQAVMFVVCDQPFITTDLLNEMIQTFMRSDKGIIAASYAETFGTPMLFAEKYFNQLLQFQNDEGAKKVAIQNKNDLAVVPFNEGEIDIDTMDAYQKLLSNENI